MSVRLVKRQLPIPFIIIILLDLVGCVSPIALHRATIAYDRAVSRIETELILLNIARHRHYHPIHFTAVSSIAATFNFTVNAGLAAVPFTNVSENRPAPLNLTLGSSAAENPTVTIVPVQGEEFTKRILTPMHESKVDFLTHQGFDLAIILRLVARGIELDGYGETGFLLNEPHEPEGYREFRRRVLHLSSLRLARSLHVGSLRFKKGNAYELGRVVMTNYDTNQLPIEERRALQEEADRYPSDNLFVDIRPGMPGGDYPLYGHISLRSFNHVLYFVAQGIVAEPEFQVNKDPRTGRIGANPPKTLYIRETKEPPDEAVFVVEESGHWYSLERVPENEQRFWEWNHKAFDILYKLFQVTVTDVTNVRAPSITIAK